MGNQDPAVKAEQQVLYPHGQQSCAGRGEKSEKSMDHGRNFKP